MHVMAAVDADDLLVEGEGMALINGSPCATALAADVTLHAGHRLRLAEAIFALSIEALAAPLDLAVFIAVLLTAYAPGSPAQLVVRRCLAARDWAFLRSQWYLAIYFWISKMPQMTWSLAPIRHEHPKRRARAAPVVGAGAQARQPCLSCRSSGETPMRVGTTTRNSSCAANRPGSKPGEYSWSRSVSSARRWTPTIIVGGTPAASRTPPHCEIT